MAPLARRRAGTGVQRTTTGASGVYYVSGAHSDRLFAASPHAVQPLSNFYRLPVVVKREAASCYINPCP